MHCFCTAQNLLKINLLKLNTKRSLGMSKNYAEGTLSNSKKKTKRTSKQRKTVKNPNIWFWVHCLAKYAPKSAKTELTKCFAGWLQEPIRRQVLSKKPKSTIKLRRTAKNSLNMILDALFGSVRSENLLKINWLNFVG